MKITLESGVIKSPSGDIREIDFPDEPTMGLFKGVNALKLEDGEMDQLMQLVANIAGVPLHYIHQSSKKAVDELWEKSRDFLMS